MSATLQPQDARTHGLGVATKSEVQIDKGETNKLFAVLAENHCHNRTAKTVRPISVKGVKSSQVKSSPAQGYRCLFFTEAVKRVRCGD